MNRFIRSSALMLTILIVASYRGHCEQESQQQPWIGEWRATTHNMEGIDYLKAGAHKVRPVLTLTHDRLTFNWGDGRVVPCSYHIDCSLNPLWIDCVVLDGPTKGGKFYGIMSIDGADLKLSLAVNDQVPRPVSFDLPSAKGTSVYYCSRVHQAENRLDENEPKRLQGTWKAEEIIKNGEKSEKFILDNARIIVQDDVFTLRWVFGQSHPHKMKINTTVTPKQIDLEGIEKPNVGSKTLGIYSLDGDKLTLCVRFGRESVRPTELNADRGTKNTLFRLVREKP